MKNENLSYKIRELADISDQSDLEWDPDKFWNLFQARKRRRHRWIVLSYSTAVMLIFAVAYLVFTAESIDRYNYINASASTIPPAKNTAPLRSNNGEGTSLSNAKPVDFETIVQNEASHFGTFKEKSNKPLGKKTRLFARKPGNSLPIRSYSTNRFIEQGTPVLNEVNDELPSLLQMFEQAQRERELRNLSVQLEDQANYNGFWLTVNQHLLANKLSSDQLHYERY
ncbi:hypothetical protein MUK70_01210 [Dyadobacter chenwenxiniae]|uniref:Uncharacterized protein n=1 Tax=Dyadobacter chenwenxiniae TaxID=2906456 RepID=A0A9X1PKK7_9BACT|nr:hypothetical protein [Dyadobacter chenwenxiniae]MCF0062633.1 hypothetical protein [Dyadobacter chenwenxiniae]UON83623.1 hypothetical protein MUK70_01210 [Dyadobacter chenwenxiniae]